MRLQLWIGSASVLALIGIGTVLPSSASQLLPLTTDSIIIQAQKKGCVGDRGARYRDFSDCVRRRTPGMGNRAARYCSRICS